VPCGFYWTGLLCICGLKWLLHNYHLGLLIFRVVVEPQNSGKSTKSPQNPQKHKNTAKIVAFETYFGYWGFLVAVNMQI